ncbi:MAG: cytochrome ubiquinol oxidase subunit I [Desulfomonilaceae bacterium]|nr:cytochrome ubiquinol oxidase subunit I [Desulfomonilaceae bacterium]
MDAVFLSRLQFAVATLFHFTFVPLTLGLSVLIAIMETKFVRTGDVEYQRMAKFWGKIFLINFVVGVVTGLTLEFQFGTNWAGYSKYVGDIFGSLLAIEATVAFFLESVFVAVWAFGWRILSPKAHAVTIWLVALGSNLSAFWIMCANSFMQHPVGYVIRDGRAELTDFWAVISQPHAIFSFLHATMAGYVVAGFFVMGVSAYHILKKNELSFFNRSFRIALIFAFIFSVGQVVIGDFNGQEMAKAQPEKLAAAEALWETTKGAPFAMLVIPDEANERNLIELFKIPKFLSYLTHRDWNAELQGLKSWPKEDRPPVTLVFWSFRIMVGFCFVFVLLTTYGLWKRNKLESTPKYLKILMLAIPLPYIAGLLGWIVTEVGRQPWIVYRVLRTADAHSPITGTQVGVSLAAFIVLYSLLGLAAFYLMYEVGRKGPQSLEG